MMTPRIIFISLSILVICEAFTLVHLPLRIGQHQYERSVVSNLYQNQNDDDDYNYEQEQQLSEESRKRFEQITKEFLKVDDDNESDFPSALPPRNPFESRITNNGNKGFTATGKGGGGKGSLYSDDELMSLLSIHNDISDELNDNVDIENSDDDDRLAISPSPSPPASLFPLHDLVMKTVGETNESDSKSDNNTSVGAISHTNILEEETFQFTPETKHKMSQIRAIASDVDGTILTNKQTIHPKTRIAIQKAIHLSMKHSQILDSTSTSNSNSNANQIQYFFPATGKSRKGALDSLSNASIEIGSLIRDNCPGVYLQGLYCVDQYNNVIFEKKLNHAAIDAAEALVEETNVSIVGYDGDNLYTTMQSDIVIHLHEHYGEPLPVLLPVITNDSNEEEGGNYIETDSTYVRKLSSHEHSMHKLLIMDDDVDKLRNIVRPKLETLAQKHDACVTQALPTMLELLPNNCSKAIGVAKLCQALSINVETELLAIGDAENDAQMLQNACIGVAVGNACPIAKDAADFVMDRWKNDDGGAGVAIEMFALSSQIEEES